MTGAILLVAITAKNLLAGGSFTARLQARFRPASTGSPSPPENAMK